MRYDMDMGCSFCRGHAHQVCSHPNCRDESKDSLEDTSYARKFTRETPETTAVRALMSQWDRGDINQADFRAALRSIVVTM